MTENKVAQATKSRSPKKATSKGAKVVATLADGVKLLEQKGKPTHFTVKEVREIIQELRIERRIGSIGEIYDDRDARQKT